MDLVKFKNLPEFYDDFQLQHASISESTNKKQMFQVPLPDDSLNKNSRPTNDTQKLTTFIKLTKNP